jgi:hypothetical protein
VVVLSPVVQAASLRDQLRASSQTVGLAGGSAFDALADNIADTAARNLPVISASAGFTYRYNPQLEAFERTSDTLGPIFLERPDTIGQGKLNFNVSFQYVEFNEFDGQSIKNLQSSDPIVIRVVDSSGALSGFNANRLKYGLGLQNYVTSFSLTYGVLDNFDVNLLVPLIATNFEVGVHSQTLEVAGPDGAFAPAPGLPQNGSTHGNAFGVGDIFLRGKYQLPTWEWLRSAAGLQLRLPSGDEANFQGTGSFEISPFLYLSTVKGPFEPHANLGVDLRTDDVARSQGRYGIGVDMDVVKRVGLSLDFLGRSEFTGSASSNDTDFLHLTPSGAVALEPLLGLDFGRKDYFDLSLGVRAVVWRQIMVFANAIYALNDAGLRNNTVIPTAGVEGTF